ncbi:B9 domain-containing protein 2 [Homalodisca vitripennis]|uniref:B9 domain-containing protein 2 n=1 Tax=Homalodisca vitripennis TaxID=197043 RepID=UPI001EEC8B87|nr:B9 domain-containing protein 2 [Homalodisca vitripennis]
MAELYAIGQIIGADRFPRSTLFCKWSIFAGSGWKLIEGHKEGQTQIDNPDFENFTYWCHPVDVHYATKGIQGWPKLHFQVYHYDEHGRSELCGYGVCHLPTSPGTHRLECCTWRPIGTYKEEFQQYFLGGGVQLQDPELVYSGCNRYKLHTQTMGTVHVEMSIILRNFEKFGIES